jgi:hypothetical protein
MDISMKNPKYEPSYGSAGEVGETCGHKETELIPR